MASGVATDDPPNLSTFICDSVMDIFYKRLYGFPLFRLCTKGIVKKGKTERMLRNL